MHYNKRTIRLFYVFSYYEVTIKVAVKFTLFIYPVNSFWSDE